jgi:hypothetical protein
LGVAEFLKVISKKVDGFLNTRFCATRIYGPIRVSELIFSPKAPCLKKVKLSL